MEILLRNRRNGSYLWKRKFAENLSGKISTEFLALAKNRPRFYYAGCPFGGSGDRHVFDAH